MNSRLYRYWLAVAVGCGAASVAASAFAQAAPIDAYIDKSAQLPLWTAPESEDTARLGETVRRLQQGVCIVGHPQAGHGTAFVISRKHRLLATNAHVADMMQKTGKLYAAMNVTGERYEVRRVWYHPGVERYLGGNRSAIARSSDPGDGEVSPLSPDLAVLQLTDAGPEPPVEFSLAAPDELKDLFGQPIGMLGYPGHDSRWDASVTAPEATYHPGVISRLTDFRARTGVPAARLQFVQHTAVGWEGFSGSPLFLADGRVVAVNNSTRTVSGSRERIAQLSHGVRIDCLWELIVHHGLEDLMPRKVDAASLDVARFSRPDPELEKYRRVLAMVLEVDRLIETENYAQAGELCGEALKLAPDFPQILAARFKLHNNYAANYQETADIAVLTEQMEAAVKYAKKYLEVAPSDPYGAVHYATALNGLAAIHYRAGLRDEEHMVKPRRAALEILNRLLSVSSLDDVVRSEGHSTRGLVRMSLGDDEGLSDLDESIRLNPTDHNVYDTRARVYAVLGRERDAEADRRKAAELKAAEAAAIAAKMKQKNASTAPIAWQTVASPEGRFRAEFPGVPIAETEERGALRLRRLQIADVNGVGYRVAFGDLPDDVLTKYPKADDRLQAVRQSLVEGKQVVEEGRVEVAGHAGWDLHLLDTEGGEYRHRLIAVGDRIYDAFAAGTTADMTTAADDVRRFIESLEPRTFGRY